MIKQTIGAILVLSFGCIGMPTAACANSTWTEQYAQAMASFQQGDYTHAREGFQKLADFGSPAAETMLGHIYLNGLGVPKKPGVAAVWYFRAAQKGYVSAQLTVGSMFASGNGFHRNIPLAYFWYEVARLRGGADVAGLAKSYQERLEPKLSAAERQQVLQDARNWRPNAATPR